MNNDNLLLLFVKAAYPGQVKRRLEPEISRDDAVHLYKAMTEDAVGRFRNLLFCDMKVTFWPPDSLDDIRIWLGEQYEYIPQEGSDLGERMSNAFVHTFTRQYKKAVIIGTDIPTLDIGSVKDTFTQLDYCDVVLGPSQDGGYYLIGLKDHHPQLFEGIDWGSDRVREQTFRAAEALHLSVHQLEMRRDIDTYSDVIHLWESLQNGQHEKDKTHMPNTYTALQNIIRKKGET